MSTKRLFFAIDLSEEARDELVHLQEAFVPGVPDNVRIRWTPRENLHLTLKFLGSMEADLVENLAETMDELVGSLEPFEMTTREIGAFPHPRHPRILWAGADRSSSERLATLHRNAQNELEVYGVQPDEHPFKAHVTFGRVKSSSSPKLDGMRPDLESDSFGSTRVEAVTLYESELDDSGATYTILHRSPLGGGDN